MFLFSVLWILDNKRPNSVHHMVRNMLVTKNDKVLILEKHNIAPEKNRFLAKVFELSEPVLF